MTTDPSSLAIDSARRIAVLETKQETMEEKLDNVINKLDALLELKTKGMGALGLVGIILSSGLVGIIMMVVNLFKGGGNHLG